jgi:hypothetical protein
MSDFDLYILKKYLFIPLLVLCIPILGGPTLQCIRFKIQLPTIMVRISLTERASSQSRNNVVHFGGDSLESRQLSFQLKFYKKIDSYVGCL